MRSQDDYAHRGAQGPVMGWCAKPGGDQAPEERAVTAARIELFELDPKILRQSLTGVSTPGETRRGARRSRYG